MVLLDSTSAILYIIADVQEHHFNNELEILDCYTLL